MICVITLQRQVLLWKHKSAKNTKRSLSLFHRLKGGFNKPAWLSKCFSALCWKGRTRISVQSWWDGAEIRSAMRCGWIYCKHVTELTNDTKEHVSSSHTIPSSFFSRIPMMNVLVNSVESLSSWVTILLWTWTTTTTLALNVTIATNIFLAGKVASSRSTWSCAPPPVMVTPDALVNGDACLLSFRLWLCNCTLTCYSVATLQAFIPWKIRYGWWNK